MLSESELPAPFTDPKRSRRLATMVAWTTVGIVAMVVALYTYAILRSG